MLPVLPQKPVFNVILWKLEPEQRADFGIVLQKCFGARATYDMRKCKYTRLHLLEVLLEQKYNVLYLKT